MTAKFKKEKTELCDVGRWKWDESSEIRNKSQMTLPSLGLSLSHLLSLLNIAENYK